MKLKLRFESKDMIRFGIFAGVVFILVVIGVSNLISLQNNSGELAGLNITYAFKKEYILTTLMLYVIAMIALVTSCKSYFFEFDKGFGFTTEKKSDGYSNWCDKKTMQKELKPVLATERDAKYGGIALINDGKTLWVDDGEYHNLVIGSTGSGKTQTVIFPLVQTLCKHNESMIITDPKGEIYEKTSQMLRSKGYKIVLLNFRSPQQGNAWNPLTLPYRLWKEGNQDKAIELLDDLALNILYDEGNKNADPFWEKTSAGYFAGIALGLFEDAKEEEININSISLMTTVGEEKLGGSTYIKEYFNAKDPNGAAYINASSTIISPQETKGSILAVFKEKIKLFATRANLSEMLSYSDFSIADIGRKKTAVFIVIQDEKKTYHSLATIFVKQVYETLIDVAYHSGGKLPVRTNFLLDEFANMPPLKDVTTMITAARSRSMRFTMIIQNFAQLNEVYGEQNAETIKGNCGNMIYLLSTELKALEEISKMCGEVKSKKDDKSVSTPLVTISDLQKMKQFEIIVRRVRLAPFKTKLTPDFKMNWGRTFPKVDIFNAPERERRPLQTFDVREFVKAKRKEKMDNLLGSSETPGGALPFFPGLPGMNDNPFGGSANPFGQGHNPLFPPQDDIDKPSGNGSFDVDAIVKKIDEQIAKIEEEERRLKEQEENNKNNLENKDINLENVVNNKELQKENTDRIEELFLEDTVNPNKIVNDQPKDNTNITVNNQVNIQNEEDDEYFDDFWD